MVCERHKQPDLKSLQELFDAQNDKPLPRWARINRCLVTPEQVHARLAELAFQRVDQPDSEDAPLLDNQYAVDQHVAEVLQFSPTANFHDHALVTSGWLILQDKVWIWGMSL